MTDRPFLGSHRAVATAGVRCGSLFRALPLLLFTGTGCVYRLNSSGRPSRLTVRLESGSPAGHVIEVAGGRSYPVSADECVTIEVPGSPRGCDVHPFGVIQIRNNARVAAPAILLKKHDATLRTLSPDQIAASPTDEQGCHHIRVE